MDLIRQVIGGLRCVYGPVPVTVPGINIAKGADFMWQAVAANELAEKGWYHGPLAVDASLVRIVNDWMDQRLADGSFVGAGVGKGAKFQNNSTIRGDQIFWLPDHSDVTAIRELNQIVDELRVLLNQELFAGLESFEGHLAVYPEGAFYRKHLDTFRTDDARKITFILYLNPAWTPEDGGHLRLYTSAEEFIDIEPKAGTVVMFNSRDFAHEVLESKAPRRSFTGWYKVRSLDF